MAHGTGFTTRYVRLRAEVYGGDFATYDEALSELIFALRHAGHPNGSPRTSLTAKAKRLRLGNSIKLRCSSRSSSSFSIFFRKLQRVFSAVQKPMVYSRAFSFQVSTWNSSWTHPGVRVLRLLRMPPAPGRMRWTFAVLGADESLGMTQWKTIGKP